MWEFIAKYWLQVIFGLIVSALTWCVRRLTVELKERQAEQKAIKEGVIAMLHDRMYQAGRYYLGKDDIAISELKNFDKLHEAYKALGGNGTGDEIAERVHEKKFREEA